MEAKKQKIKHNFPLILASGSLARKKILLNSGLKFKIIKPEFDEELAKPAIKHLSIKNQAIYLAKQKALSIAIQNAKSLVIGSDQICELSGVGIDKSKNYSEAVLQLQKLRGKTHIQNNALCLYLGKKLLFCHHSQAKLKMRNLTDSEIENYVEIDQSWGCAGSYKFESLGKHLFIKITGTDDTIIGINILPLLNFMHQKQLISL